MPSSSVLPSFHDRQTLDLLQQADSSLLSGRKVGRERRLESESSGEGGEVEEDVSDEFSSFSIDGSNEVSLNDLRKKEGRRVSLSVARGLFPRRVEKGTHSIPLISVDDASHGVESIKHRLRADKDGVVQF